jgi:hypothetical protein
MNCRRALVGAVLVGSVAVACRQIAGYDGDTVEPDQQGEEETGVPPQEAGPPGDTSTADNTHPDPDVSVPEAESGPPPTDGGGGVEDAPPPNDTGPTGCAPPSAEAGVGVVPDPGFETVNAGLGWTCLGNCSFTVTSSQAHCGKQSGEGFNRNQGYEGPGYMLPTNAANYKISAWIMQDGASPLLLLFSAKLVCVTPIDAGGDGGQQTSYPYVSQVETIANTWTQLTGTLSVPSGCTLALLYLNQNTNSPLTDAGPQFPNLYIDDVYIYAQ